MRMEQQVLDTVRAGLYRDCPDALRDARAGADRRFEPHGACIFPVLFSSHWFAPPNRHWSRCTVPPATAVGWQRFVRSNGIADPVFVPGWPPQWR
ncbi:hypothetical protein AB3H13_27455 [Escherichia coli]